MSEEKDQSPRRRIRDSSHGSLLDDPYVRQLIADLDELEKSTRPDDARTASGKDLKAFEALMCVSELVEYVAGWAIDHQIGLALSDLSFVPLQPSQTAEDPAYLEAKTAVDQHVHERKADEAEYNEDPKILRRALRNLLKPGISLLPANLTEHLSEALSAIEYGEVLPIIEPVRSGRKRNYTALRLQLKAIGLVEYRRAMGLRKEAALEAVAEMLGISPNTIVSWNARLKEYFGDLEVNRYIAISRNHASSARANKQARGGDSYNDEAAKKLKAQMKAAGII